MTSTECVAVHCCRTAAERLPEGKNDPHFATKPQLAQQLIEEACQAGVPFRAVVADSFYGEHYKLTHWLRDAHIPFVLALKPTHEIRQYVPDWNNPPPFSPQEAAQRLPIEQWQAFQRTFADGHQATWYVADLEWGYFGPERPWRLVTFTADSTTLKPDQTSYLYTNMPASQAPAAEIAHLYSLREWIEVFYRQAKGELGWHDWQIRDAQAIVRHWQLVFCAYSFVLRRANWKFIHGTSRRLAMFNWWLLLFSFTFLDLFSIWSLVYDYQSERELAQAGHIVQGTVIEKEYDPEALSTFVIYRFIAEMGSQQGQTFTKRQRVKHYAYDKIQLNSPVQIAYLPRNPRASKLAGMDADLGPNNAPMIKLLLLGGNILLVFVAFSKSRRNWQLAHTGRIIPGHLTSFHYDKHDELPSVYVKFSFVSPTGALIEGKDSTRKASADYKNLTLSRSLEHLSRCYTPMIAVSRFCEPTSPSLARFRPECSLYHSPPSARG
jgi:hypothetical protein